MVFFFSKDKYFIKPTCLIESTIDTSHLWIFKTQSIGNVGLKRPSRNSKTLKTQIPSTHLCCLFTRHARCIISTIKEMEIVPFLRYPINCLFFCHPWWWKNKISMQMGLLTNTVSWQGWFICGANSGLHILVINSEHLLNLFLLKSVFFLLVDMKVLVFHYGMPISLYQQEKTHMDHNIHRHYLVGYVC